MSFPISFTKLEAIPLSRDPAQILIRWDIAPTKADLRDFEFYIDSGEAPDQIPAFQAKTIDGAQLSAPSSTSQNQYQVAGPISALDFYQYRDFTPRLKNLLRFQYYRIRARRISTQEEIGSRTFTWQGDLDVVGLYIVEEHNFLLEDAIGAPCFVYVRRRGGIPCQKCFDPVLKKRTASHCQTCFGTNWEGGFFKPIDTFVDFSPDQKNTVIQEWGETQPQESDALLSNYPEVSPGDVVRELREGRMWRVTRAKQTEKRRTPMLQFVRMVEINPGDVEQKIPYDQELALSIIQRFETIRAKREF